MVALEVVLTEAAGTSDFTGNAGASPFSISAAEYDQWFARHPLLFESELAALKQAVPQSGRGIEIGVGTGRFAEQLGVATGIDPAPGMADIAKSRGIDVKIASAERIPFPTESFDFALLVTVDCFLKNMNTAFVEIARILKADGAIIVGMIDRTSWLGLLYSGKQSSNKFYSGAHFHSPDEVSAALRFAGFTECEFWQTLLHSTESQIEKPECGHGLGGFVVIRARLNKHGQKPGDTNE